MKFIGPSMQDMGGGSSSECKIIQITLGKTDGIFVDKAITNANNNTYTIPSAESQSSKATSDGGFYPGTQQYIYIKASLLSDDPISDIIRRIYVIPMNGGGATSGCTQGISNTTINGETYIAIYCMNSTCRYKIFYVEGQEML